MINKTKHKDYFEINALILKGKDENGQFVVRKRRGPNSRKFAEFREVYTQHHRTDPKVYLMNTYKVPERVATSWLQHLEGTKPSKVGEELTRLYMETEWTEDILKSRRVSGEGLCNTKSKKCNDILAGTRKEFIEYLKKGRKKGAFYLIGKFNFGEPTAFAICDQVLGEVDYPGIKRQIEKHLGVNWKVLHEAFKK